MAEAGEIEKSKYKSLELWFAKDSDVMIPACVYERRKAELEQATLDSVVVDFRMDNLVKITKYDEAGNEVVTFQK